MQRKQPVLTWMNMNMSKEAIDALIEEVRKRPVLWNPKHALYHHRALINSQWVEVADKLKAPASILKTKWKGLRDNFRKEVKKLIQRKQTESVWIHMKQLNFLWNVLDTSQLECTDAMLQHLRTANRALVLSEEDKFIIHNVSKIDDQQYFNSFEIVEDSLDFHDVIFQNGFGGETENNSSAQGIADDDDYDEFSDPDIMEVEAEPNDLVVIDDDEDDLGSLPPLTSRRNPSASQVNETPPSPPPLRIISTHSLAPINTSKIVGPLKRKEDSDEHFIKSLLPFLAQIPTESKRRVRNEIQRIVMSACMNEIKKQKLKRSDWQTPDSTESSTKTYMKRTKASSSSITTISTKFDKPESDQEEAEEENEEDSVEDDEGNEDINIYLKKPRSYNRLIDKMDDINGDDSSTSKETISPSVEAQIKTENTEHHVEIKQENGATEQAQSDTPTSTVADETLIKLELSVAD